jgi:hypothetical protein
MSSLWKSFALVIDRTCRDDEQQSLPFQGFLVSAVATGRNRELNPGLHAADSSMMPTAGMESSSSSPPSRKAPGL